MAEENVVEVEVLRTRRVEDMRGVDVKVPLLPWEFEIFISSYRVDDGKWSPGIVRMSIGRDGQNGFKVEDWAAIRDGIDRAVAAFRSLEAA